jgi:hypothetical protein
MLDWFIQFLIAAAGKRSNNSSRILLLLCLTSRGHQRLY